MISWSRLSQSLLAREKESFCAINWFVLGYILIFPHQNFVSVLFLFRTILGYLGHVCILVKWQIFGDTADSSFFVMEVTCYSPSGYVLFGQHYLLCQWTCTTSLVVSYHSKWHVKCLPFSSSIIFFSLHFPSSRVSASETISCSRVQSLCSYLFLMWLSIQMPCPSIGFLFSGFWISFIL